jgi:hypothetical protein
MERRRFPPPWSVEEQDACFVLRDANGQALGYFYFANLQFCDYSSFGACMDRGEGQQGTCVPRRGNV